MPRHEVLVHFYEVSPESSLGTRIWSKLLRPRYTHVSVQMGGLLFSMPSDQPSGWWNAERHTATTPPRDTIQLFTRSSLSGLYLVMAQTDGWMTQKVRSALSVLTGYPRHPRNCTTSVCRILNALFIGLAFDAVTPDQLHRQLQQQLHLLESEPNE